MADVENIKGADCPVIKRAFPGANHVELRLLAGRPVIWRPRAGHRGAGCVEYELAAYQVSHFLELSVVAKAWAAQIDGEPGVMQEFIDGVALDQYYDPERAEVYASAAYKRIRLFDYLVGNPDRYDWHVFRTETGVKSVDHTNVFRYADVNTVRCQRHLLDAKGLHVLAEAGVAARRWVKGTLRIPLADTVRVELARRMKAVAAGEIC